MSLILKTLLLSLVVMTILLVLLLITTEKMITTDEMDIEVKKLKQLSKTGEDRTSLNSCKADPIISFRPQGRFGNQICEYIHLLHAHKTFSIEAGIHPGMRSRLKGTFPNLTLKRLSAGCFKELNRHKVEYKAAIAAMATRDGSSAMMTGTPCQPYLWWPLRSLLRQELEFSKDLQRNATWRTSRLVREWSSHRGRNESVQDEKVSEPVPPPSAAVVGVHVRRGDYLHLLNKYNNDGLMPATYYHRAFQYCRQRFDRPVFLVLTEPAERNWCRKHLAVGADDVIVVDESASAKQDLALLASTKHIIYSHGTFGLMGILLSDAKTVVYPAAGADKKKRRYALHMGLDIIRKNWTSIEFVTI